MSNDFSHDKELNKATLGDIFNAYRKAQWNNSYAQEVIKKFLGVDDIKDTTSLTRLITTYERHIIAAIFAEFTEKNGFAVEQAFNAGDSGTTSYEYENIEVAYKEVKRVISEGKLLISGPDQFKMVLSLEYYSQQEKELEICVIKKDSAKAEKFLNELFEYATKNNYLKNKKIAPDFTFLETNKNYTWDSVILDDKTKSKITKNLNVILNNLEIYNINKIPFKRGIVLKGVPGVGKTLIGKILCNLSDITMIWVTPKYLESARQVAMIGDLARELAPTILFLEDIDMYGESRDSSSNKSLLGELMSQLDGITENKNVIVIATTNRGDELEKALRNRPGRFDATIEIPLPGSAEREKMLRLYANKFTCGEINFKDISDKCDDKYTGAHVKDLVDLAVMTAIEERSYDGDKKIVLKQEHFEKNIKRVGAKKIEISDAFKPKKTRTEYPSLDDYPDE
jgi:SpoVK/Ycf46/Vps4 family AAA+-type ATPase